MATQWLRTVVSHNRLRTDDDEAGVSLDLSYITPRIIAMAYPAERGTAQGIIRNKAADVKRFLDRRHAGRYKVRQRRRPVYL